jgi:hypothetical protein
MSGIGHNGGPTMEPGYGFRKVAWTKARQSLLPTLPLEIVRVRVARAKRLGLPYRTYATIRATSGGDIVGFLFSDMMLDMPRGARLVGPDAARRFSALDGAAHRVAALHAPRDVAAVLAANRGVIDSGGRAPPLLGAWGAARATLRGMIREAAVNPDGVVLIAEERLERDWCAAAGLAGVIPRSAFEDAPRGGV